MIYLTLLQPTAKTEHMNNIYTDTIKYFPPNAPPPEETISELVVLLKATTTGIK